MLTISVQFCKARYMRLATVRYYLRELLKYGLTLTWVGLPPKMCTQCEGLPELRFRYEGARQARVQRMHRPWRKMMLPLPRLVYAERKTMG